MTAYPSSSSPTQHAATVGSATVSSSAVAQDAEAFHTRSISHQAHFHYHLCRPQGSRGSRGSEAASIATAAHHLELPRALPIRISVGIPIFVVAKAKFGPDNQRDRSQRGSGAAGGDGPRASHPPGSLFLPIVVAAKVECGCGQHHDSFQLSSSAAFSLSSVPRKHQAAASSAIASSAAAAQHSASAHALAIPYSARSPIVSLQRRLTHFRRPQGCLAATSSGAIASSAAAAQNAAASHALSIRQNRISIPVFGTARYHAVAGAARQLPARQRRITRSYYER